MSILKFFQIFGIFFCFSGGLFAQKNLSLHTIQKEICELQELCESLSEHNFGTVFKEVKKAQARDAFKEICFWVVTGVLIYVLYSYMNISGNPASEFDINSFCERLFPHGTVVDCLKGVEVSQS